MDSWMKLLILIAACALVAAIRILPHRTGGSRKELTGHATVLSRRVDQGSPVAGGGHTRWNYKVVFQVGNTPLELLTTEAEYRSLKEGAKGILFWQGDEFCSFTPETND